MKKHSLPQANLTTGVLARWAKVARMAKVAESGEEEQHDGGGMVPLQVHHELF